MTTTNDIKTLREQAIKQDDTALRILCDMALDGEDSEYDEDCLDDEGRPDYSGGGHSASELDAIREALRMSQDEARAECERMLRKVSNYNTGARLEGVPSAALIDASDAETERTGTGAVLAYLDAGVWQYVRDDQESFFRDVRGEDVITVYVEA